MFSRGVRVRSEILSATAIGLATACAGRSPQPVASVQPQDMYADCTMIRAEIEANNAKTKELADEQGWKVALIQLGFPLIRQAGARTAEILSAHHIPGVSQFRTFPDGGGCCRGLDGVKLIRACRCIPQNGDFFYSGDNLAYLLEPFAAQSRSIEKEACEITSRVSEACHIATGDGIAFEIVCDNW